MIRRHASALKWGWITQNDNTNVMLWFILMVYKHTHTHKTKQSVECVCLYSYYYSDYLRNVGGCRQEGVDRLWEN